MTNQYKYKAIRPKLWEVIDQDGRAVGRIRHEFCSTTDRLGWQAANGEFYEKAEQAAAALFKARKLGLVASA